jgi:hypothetical protein
MFILELRYINIGFLISDLPHLQSLQERGSSITSNSPRHHVPHPLRHRID